jgi:predicted ATPase
MIEQPELHLHPRIQGDLADLFIETALKGPQQNTYILETHSEHIIRRLMRRVREGVISESDVSILYVDRSDDGSIISHLRLDSEGDFLDEWPNGFFEEGFNDTLAGR